MRKVPSSSTQLNSELIKLHFENEEIKIESPPVSTCEKVKEFRGNLIANVTHDLRTPLQSIIGYSETLMLKEKIIPSEDQQKYLDIILTNANKLSDMIENFYEYSKLEISEIVPQMSPLSVGELINELNQNYKIISSKYGVSFNIHSEENLTLIYGDYQMIYRVFQNLIDNALKFTPEGGIINVSLVKCSECELKIEISDTGSGIPHDELDSIFNKFKTSRDTAWAKKQNDGLGLGLAIVKKILSLHNASIFVNSDLGQGTTFTFFLPLSKV